MMGYLISTGASVNFENESTGQTPLHKAIGSRNIEAVKLLLAKGGDPKKKSLSGLTALEAAEAVGEVEIVKILQHAIGCSDE